MRFRGLNFLFLMEQPTNQFHELGEKPVGKLLMQYAIPAIVAMAASSVYNIIDGIFIGQGVGPEAIMGLALTGPLMSLTAAFGAMVGVGARASGMARDSRKDMGFGIYDEFDFDVVTETTGDVEARIKVRVGEVRESLKIVRQVISKLRRNAEVELAVDLGELRTLEGSWGISESPRGDNIHWLMLDENGRIDRSFIRSASYPNWPALTVAVQGDIIPDFPLINKSFELCYACIDR